MNKKKLIPAILFAVLLVALMGCSNNKQNLNPTPEGKFETWYSGQQVNFIVEDTTLISDVEGIGPQAVSLIGIPFYLGVHDPIRREYNSITLEFGYIESIDYENDKVVVFIYNQAKVIKD